MVSSDSDIPEEIREILDEEFGKTRKHSRCVYTQVFVDEGADTFRQSLIRRDVEKILERECDDIEFKTTKSTSNRALKDLVKAGILESEEKEGCPHRYWLMHSLDVTDDQTSETKSSRSPSTVQSTERNSLSLSTALTGSSEPTATRSTGDGAWSPALQIRGMVSLLALVAGLFLTIVTLVLLRLPVITALWLESATLAWGLISLGLAAGVVAVTQEVRRNLGTFSDIESM